MSFLCIKTTEKNEKGNFSLNNGKTEINAKISTKWIAF